MKVKSSFIRGLCCDGRRCQGGSINKKTNQRIWAGLKRGNVRKCKVTRRKGLPATISNRIEKTNTCISVCVDQSSFGCVYKTDGCAYRATDKREALPQRPWKTKVQSSILTRRQAQSRTMPVRRANALLLFGHRRSIQL